MRIFFIIILFFCVNSSFGQKPIIDSIAYKQWPSLDRPTISNSGKYVFYTIENVPVGSKTLFVQSTDGKWKKEFRGGLKDGNGGGLSDKYFFFINKNDSLGILTLGTNQIKYIPNTSWYNLLANKGVEYLRYPSPSGHNSKDFVLKNLKTNNERIFTDVDSYRFDGDILALIKSVQDADHKQSINIVDITTGRISKVWEGYRPENLVLDVKHRQLAFKANDSVWYYKFDSGNAVCIFDKYTSDIEADFTLGYLESFSKDGKAILTSLIRKGETIKPKNEVVKIWGYKDIMLLTETEKAIIDRKYLSVINIKDHQIIRLQQEEGESFQFSKTDNAQDTLGLIQNPRVGDMWSNALKFTWNLVTIKNGKRKKLDFLNKNNIGFGNIELSPIGKYIVYFDRIAQNYFSYEIATGAIRNLTEALSVVWTRIDRDDLPNPVVGVKGLATWLKNDKYVLVYDRYDIWKLDPLNLEKPVNLTNGYGKRNQIVFNCMFDSNTENIVSSNDKLYLTAFDEKNKNNGFFIKLLDKIGDPELLHMGPYLYQTNSGYVPQGCNFSPIKAKYVNTYIVQRMSATDAPNYFSTKDFKTFIRLSNLQPHKKYNWYTTELHSWKSLDGRTLQGILYKPEDFNYKRQYPVIFHYYERKSDGLNAFIEPEPLSDDMNINIPTYVSNGYLVFCPDIYYEIGNPMQGTYDAVVSASNYVSTLPFVNDKKIGLEGGSFGGLQTNYLVTHSNLFEVAVSSSGLSDMVSGYGDLKDGIANSLASYFEIGQGRMGKNLWEQPSAYIRNSPIFDIHKVSTPLLLMHTKKDGIYSYTNIIEFFVGLRRMGKKAWMLVYSEGNHGIEGKEADDFSIRMMQFFDYYLKDKPAPIWMLDSSKDMNRKDSLELDSKGRIPGPNLLTAEEQRKVDNLMTRSTIRIILK